MPKPTFAVVLSGSGGEDGSEIHQAVLTLLAIDRQGGRYECFAPDVSQHDVVDHLTGQPVAETRNAMTESARIARGHIAPLASFDADRYEGLIFPGGSGAAKTLSSFAEDGPECVVLAEVERAIRSMAAARKPIGALCVAPVLLAAVLNGVDVTVGSEVGTESALEQMGARHVVAGAGDVVIDRVRRVVTAPAYMIRSSISQIADGIEAMVRAMMEMVGE